MGEDPLLVDYLCYVKVSRCKMSTDFLIKENSKSGSGNKPYTNSRPSYGKNQVNEVWENAKDPITGKVYDPSGVEITWDKTKSRNGQ